MSDLSDVDVARNCFLFLEEFIECIELRDKNDRQLCDVCKKKFAFHRRKNAISFASSNPLEPPTLSNNNSVVVRAAANVLPALPYSSFSSSNTSCLDFPTVLPAPLSPSNTQLNGSMPVTSTLNGMLELKVHEVCRSLMNISIFYMILHQHSPLD